MSICLLLNEGIKKCGWNNWPYHYPVWRHFRINISAIRIALTSNDRPHDKAINPRPHFKFIVYIYIYRRQSRLAGKNRILSWKRQKIATNRLELIILPYNLIDTYILRCEYYSMKSICVVIPKMWHTQWPG